LVTGTAILAKKSLPAALLRMRGRDMRRLDVPIGWDVSL